MYSESLSYRLTISDNRFNLSVRESQIVMLDGEEISRTYNRYTLNPGADLTEEPQIVKDVAAVIWTPSIVQAYNNGGN